VLPRVSNDVDLLRGRRCDATTAVAGVRVGFVLGWDERGRVCEVDRELLPRCGSSRLPAWWPAPPPLLLLTLRRCRLDDGAPLWAEAPDAWLGSLCWEAGRAYEEGEEEEEEEEEEELSEAADWGWCGCRCCWCCRGGGTEDVDNTRLVRRAPLAFDISRLRA